MTKAEAYELPPGTPTAIAGAKEVWEAGGKVYVMGLQPSPSGQKWSTTSLVEKMRRVNLAALFDQYDMTDGDWRELMNDALGG